MKAISVWQPWASLLFSPGEFRKVFETRPRTMGMRKGDRLAIHAGLSIEGIKLVRGLAGAGYGDDLAMILDSITAQFDHAELDDLPRGCVLGTVEVVQTIGTAGQNPSAQEEAFGNWTPGRFAIETRDPQVFDQPIPFRGAQGVFYIPDHQFA